MNTKRQIANELCTALRDMGAHWRLLGPVCSHGDTLDDEELLHELKAYNACAGHDDKARLDWLSTATQGRELILGGREDGAMHWLIEDWAGGGECASKDGLRAAIDKAMERERGE
jgi:hypothetical protein